MDLFQSKNILSDSDYAELMQVKDSVFMQKPGCMIIDGSGNLTITRTDSIGSPIDLNAIFNYKMDIEGYSIKYPPIFIKLLKSIQSNLIEHGLVNPRPYICRTYRNNCLTPWHKHTKLDNVKNTKWYCLIYYMHPNWDTSYGGQLRVSKVADFPGEKFDCLSNSFVTHNGYYGHAVEELKKGYEGERDIFLTHWVTD